MKISLNWLKQYVNINLPLADVAEILTNTGLEVEDIYSFQTVEGGLEGLKIGEIKSVEKHPDADKLVVTHVDVGNGEALQIVCGAPNVDAGQKVVVATVGSTLYPVEGDHFKIRKAKIRGVESFGMICAEDEIGLGTAHDGIMVLPKEVPAGQNASEYFKIEHDQVFEIGLTPNRADGNSHIGVARDYVAAMNVLFEAGLEVKWPDLTTFKIDNTSLQIPVKVENPKACPRYCGITISGVTVKESPDWLKNRLKAIDQRPINNIVDITNYVLHEYGQPLHAFDADQVTGGEVIVKTMSKGSKFTTLDEVERKLDEEDLMICNRNEGMCIAGVFGGMKSGVTSGTKNIFLESAFFDPTYIRKTSTRHGLRTDAATHFEKGIDPECVVPALKRAAMLIKEIAGGAISSEIIDIYDQSLMRRKIDVSKAHIDRLAGMQIPMEKIQQIFKNLDIEVLDNKDGMMKVSVPRYRADVTREADVIEEILRIYGYNNIALPSFLRSNIAYSENINSIEIFNSVADVLTGKGFAEIMNNSISKSSYYANDLKHEASSIYMSNSMTAELDMLRTSMLHSGLEVLVYNINRKNDRLQLFEFGKTYHKQQNEFFEKTHLSLFMTGAHISENWMEPQKPVDFYHIKGIVDNVLSRLNINSHQEGLSKSPLLSNGYQYQIDNQNLVDFGEVSAQLHKQFDIDATVFYADFNWDLILNHLKGHDVKFKSVAKYPAVRRDLALLLDEAVSFKSIREIAFKQVRQILKDVNLFDIYRGKTIEDGKKSYAVSYIFEDQTKTLTDKEIDKIMKKLISAYGSQLNATIR